MSKKNPSEPKTKKTTYRVQNWREYNASLVQRGAITIWIAADEVTAWTPARRVNAAGNIGTRMPLLSAP
jgi:hypothetical protein